MLFGNPWYKVAYFWKSIDLYSRVWFNQGHIIIHVEPNFTLDLHKPTLQKIIKVLIQLNRLTMKLNESALVVYPIVTYKVQTHIFFMSYSNLFITKFIVEKGRIMQPKTFKKNQLIFPQRWISMNKIIGPCRSMRPHEWIEWQMEKYQFLFLKKQSPYIHVKSIKLKESIQNLVHICLEDLAQQDLWDLLRWSAL